MKFCVDKIWSHSDCPKNFVGGMPVGHLLKMVELMHDRLEVFGHARRNVGHACQIIKVRVCVVVLPHYVLVAVVLCVEVVMRMMVCVPYSVGVQNLSSYAYAGGVDRHIKIGRLVVHNQKVLSGQNFAGVIRTKSGRSKIRIISDVLDTKLGFDS